MVLTPGDPSGSVGGCPSASVDALDPSAVWCPECVRIANNDGTPLLPERRDPSVELGPFSIGVAETNVTKNASTARMIFPEPLP